MIAGGLLLILLLLAAGVGRNLLRWLRALPDTPTERLLVSLALGLGVLAYAVLLLGLLPFRLLAPVPVLLALALLAAVSWRGWTWEGGARRKAKGASEGGGQRISRRAAEPQRGKQDTGFGIQDSDGLSEPSTLNPQPSTFLRVLPLFALLVLGLPALVACFVPPGAHEWDALSYHLAVPKLWLEQRQITYLPTQHHSNFPFLVEMLFLLGLMLQGYALANLFHLAMGALCAAAVWMLGRRFAPGAGPVGALAFASAPIVLWEAGAAYIELGMALYVTLSVGAALAFRETKEPRRLLLAGVLMGFALSVKALALAPFLLVALLLLVERARFKNLRWYLLGAVVVGCPFYVKSALMTGNPVYPFAYRWLGGKNWSAELAAPYEGEQRSYGQNRRGFWTVADDLRLVAAPTLEPGAPPGTADRLRNLLLAPFSLVAIPRFFYNWNDPGLFNHAGFLFLALPPLLLLAGGASSAGKWTGALAALWFAAWSQTMQYSRYLIPLLPLLGLAGGEGVVRAARRWKLVGWLAGLVVFVQAALTLTAFAPRLPEQWTRATDPAAREAYLTRSVNSYAAMQWLNVNTPPGAGVVLFEETRGFYLNRPYLWGNAGHSLYIPYATFADGREMADWFRQQGYRYALLNLQFSPLVISPEQLRDAVASGTLPDLARQLYHPRLEGGERWRRLLGEALDDGAAVALPEASSRAAVVLEFRPPEGAP